MSETNCVGEERKRESAIMEAHAAPVVKDGSF